MPMNAQQLIAGANYQLESYAKTDPIDQINTKRPTLAWLIANKQEVVYGNGIFNEKVFKSNDGNYQNYYGDDQVSYNRRDPVRLAAFNYYNHHDGFGLNEDELKANGILMTDDRNAVVTGAEKIQIVNLLKVNRMALKEGIQTALNLELLGDGSLDAKSAPGLDLLVSTTPGSTTVGGIPDSTSTYWQNNVSLNISVATAGNLVAKMETEWRKCVTYGNGAPDFIVAGSDFIDAYRVDAGLTINRQLEGMGNAKGGVTLDASVSGLFFHGVPIVWDPTFAAMDTLYSPTELWEKRCYFLNSKDLKLRPYSGSWMVQRTPPRMYDRYIHYFGMTSSYGLTVSKRNGMSVMTID